MRRLLALVAILVLAVGALAPAALAKDGDDDAAQEADDRDSSGPSTDSGSDSREADDDDGDAADDAEDAADDRADAAEDRADDNDADDTTSPGDDDGTPDQGSGDAPGTPGGGPVPPAGGGGGSPAPGGGAPAAVRVSMGDKTFSPASVSVAVGGTVTWTNASDRDHTATADDGSFDSDVMAAGRSYQFRFPKAGTVSYRCLIHSGMTGTVNVGGGSASGAGSGSAGGATSSSAAGSSGSPTLGSPNVSAPPGASVAGVPAPSLAQAAGGTATVKIADFDFAPAALTVAPGTEVKWTNAGQALHTVTGDGGLDSGTLRSGQGYRHTFNDVGTFSYVCDFHPDMTATVKVAEGATTGAGQVGGSAGPTSTAGDDAASTIGAGDVQSTSAGLASTGAQAALAVAAAVLAITAGVVLLRRRSSAA